MEKPVDLSVDLPSICPSISEIEGENTQHSVTIEEEQLGRSPQQTPIFKPDDVALWRDPENLFLANAPIEELPIVSIGMLDGLGAYCLSDHWDEYRLIPLEQLEAI
ncbi:MAG: hypothetical protein F6J87_28350 [Spirulina sp. SIO3F2]|nr:hypothetical protein [Spirulina sp. SIO3F2]